MEKIYIAKPKSRADYQKLYEIAQEHAFVWIHVEDLLELLECEKPYSWLVHIDMQERTFTLMRGITVCAAACSRFGDRILSASEVEYLFMARSNSFSRNNYLIEVFTKYYHYSCKELKNSSLLFEVQTLEDRCRHTQNETVTQYRLDKDNHEKLQKALTC